MKEGNAPRLIFLSNLSALKASVIPVKLLVQALGKSSWKEVPRTKNGLYKGKRKPMSVTTILLRIYTINREQLTSYSQSVTFNVASISNLSNSQEDPGERWPRSKRRAQQRYAQRRGAGQSACWWHEE